VIQFMHRTPDIPARTSGVQVGVESRSSLVQRVPGRPSMFPRLVTLFICVIGGCVAASVPVSARDVQEPALPARVIGTGDVVFFIPDETQWGQRLGEMQRWITDYENWKRWYEVWRNKPEPGWIGHRDRRRRPDPPTWLDDECRDVVQDHGILVDACRLLADWKDEQIVLQMRRQTTQTQVQHEAPTKNVWWEYVHFDALWAMPQVGASVFGVLGMHATVQVAGRFQVFVAPGAILLNLPNGKSREWRPATDWGMAYRIVDFTFPGTRRRASLHLNLARAWVLAGPSNVIKSSIDLAGFSVTFKKTPPPAHQ